MAPNPDFIGRFKVVRRLGEGGMGSVYLAQDPRVKPARMVAIKILKDDSPDLRERFAREVGIVANFEHPNIVHVYEVDDHNGHPFMAMAYVKGETLAELIRRGAPLAIPRKLEILEQLCNGLAYAHRQDVIHRDIKPANIMIDSEETLKILDFGVAKLADSTLTVSGSVMSTPNYMSPEQIDAGEVGPPSDIFAVGALAYELLACRKAFPGQWTEAFLRIKHQEPEPLEKHLPGADPAIVSIIERALRKDPAARFQDLALMQRELMKVRRRLEETQDVPTIPNLESAARKSRRSWPPAETRSRPGISAPRECGSRKSCRSIARTPAPRRSRRPFMHGKSSGRLGNGWRKRPAGSRRTI